MEQIVMAEILIIRKEHSDSFVAIYIHCTWATFYRLSWCWLLIKLISVALYSYRIQ
jgi:hypothetical protein